MKTETPRLRPFLLIMLAIMLTLTTTARRARVKALTCTANPVVTTNADSGGGSLRDAISNACDGSTITFANNVITHAATITLASELAVDKNLTIQGPGANLLTISGNHTVRVFNIGSVNPGINVTISGLTIANGTAPVMILPPFILFPGGFGGGVLNSSTGTLTITNSMINGNTATSNITSGLGGGLLNVNSGIVNVSNSTISGNIGIVGAGAANFGSGAVNVANSICSGNNAFVAGCISNFKGTVTVSNSTISLNSASDEGGGAIETGAGTVTITGSIFSGNSAVTHGVGAGGAILCTGGSNVTISSSTFSGNTAVTGGVINSQGATLIVKDSTFAGNGAGIIGAILNLDGTATIAGSTFSGNVETATDFASFGHGVIFNSTASTALTVNNCTFSGNAAAAGAGFLVPGINNFRGTASITSSTFSGNDAGISGGFTFAPTATNVRNTISAGNSAFDVSGTFASQGHNLIGKGDGGSGFTNGVNSDQVGSIASPLDPRLGPLQNNGGPTATMALLPGSPAIDAGDDSVLGSPLFLTTDQRGPGFPRKSGLHVDIGAFEVQVFNTCLRDNTTGNLLQWNSTTGQYKFTRCSDGFMLTGTGTVALVNGIRTLRDFKTDRRISAGFNTGQLTGNATLYLMVAQGVWQSFQIVDTNPAAVCACPG